MKFMGSSSECAPAGARSKFSVESTTHGQGGLSPTNLVGNANLKVERWLTLGNQLGGDQIYEEDLATRIKARCALLLYGLGRVPISPLRYPDRVIDSPYPAQQSHPVASY